MGKWGGIEVLARAGSGEGEMGRGNLEGKGGNGKGEMGREQQEGGDSKGANGRGRRRGKRRGDFTDGYDKMPRWTYGMPGWNEVTKFSHFVYPCNAGYPSWSILMKQVIVYLSVYLFIYQFGYGRPNRVA